MSSRLAAVHRRLNLTKALDESNEVVSVIVIAVGDAGGSDRERSGEIADADRELDHFTTELARFAGLLSTLSAISSEIARRKAVRLVRRIEASKCLGGILEVECDVARGGGDVGDSVLAEFVAAK